MILGELDYLLRTRLVDAELQLVADLQAGDYELGPLTAPDLTRIRALLKRYRDLDLGLVDAAVMATAERVGTRRILTVDERNFRAVVSASGSPFVLLPADA